MPDLFFPDLLNLGSEDRTLIAVDSIKEDSLPTPLSLQNGRTEWNDPRNVRLPDLSPGSAIFEGLSNLTIIQEEIEDVTKIMDQYTKESYDYVYIYKLFDTELSIEKQHHYLTNVIPGMAKLALRLPQLITQPIPRLLTGARGSVTLSQEQAACLLANAFFCTFPDPPFDLRWRKTYFNFNKMYGRGRKCKMYKIWCLLHYFDSVLQKMPDGVISIRRHRISDNTVVDFSSMDWSLCNLVVHEKGRIEDDEDMVEIDFANKYIGGGVLNAECVQEEIRFVLSPELLVSMLICERMDDLEAISIVGTQRFNDYSGYGDAFKFEERPAIVVGERDRFKRIKSEIVAINATKFNNPRLQYSESAIRRELLKAYAGYARLDDQNRAIATGNWGCGVYKGDKQLKSLIQLLAASAHHRKEIHYFTFDDKEFSIKLEEVFSKLKETTVARLMELLLRFEEGGNKKNLFDFITETLTAK